MNHAGAEHFRLDPRLASDTVFIADWSLCRVLLMDDARFPWLVLVPRRAQLVELDDLDEVGRTRLLREIQRAAHALRRVATCDKLNLGILGNIVRQLHVHIVARTRNDAAWPGPVWGHGPARPYALDARSTLIAALQHEIGDEHDATHGPRHAGDD